MKLQKIVSRLQELHPKEIDLTATCALYTAHENVQADQKEIVDIPS